MNGEQNNSDSAGNSKLKLDELQQLISKEMIHSRKKLLHFTSAPIFTYVCGKCHKIISLHTTENDNN